MEKEEKFAKLRKQHERELRMLAVRSQKKVDNIFKSVGGQGQDKLNTKEILKYEYASAPIKVSSFSQIFLKLFFFLNKSLMRIFNEIDKRYIIEKFDNNL